MNDELLRCVELDPPGPARWSVLWMHGLGASGHDFPPVVPLLELDDAPGVRFVFPHAPPRPVTINGGFVMPAWYDILEADLDRRIDAEGLAQSVEQVRALMQREIDAGVPAERIVLAGFSQGGAVALHTALAYPERLGGLIALSTYLPREEDVEPTASARELSVFAAHGTHDPMVPIAAGRAARDRLQEWGLDVTWREYPMAHEVSMDEIRDLGTWLRELFAA